MTNRYAQIAERICTTGIGLARSEAYELIKSPSDDLKLLARAADDVRRFFRGNRFEPESITNIKSGACPEDCSFCSQSAHYTTDADKYPLITEEETLKRALHAQEAGATKFCLVAAWREPSKGDFQKIIDIIRRLHQETALDVHCSLGFLTDSQVDTLKAEGVKRYNHNLETAESFFPKICTTHTWQERMDTVKRVKRAGLELCSGGIIGMGETLEERVDLAFSAAQAGVDEFPLNILNPRSGTPMDSVECPDPLDVICTISVFRLIMPKVVIKVSGGREVALGSHQAFAFQAGADSFILGDYLTTKGGDPREDLEMIRKLGFEIESR